MSEGTASFGDLLRQLRSAASLSQEELAARAGLSVRGISDLERGARHAPRLETVRMLADALALGEDDRAALLAAARPAILRRGAADRARPTLLSLPIALDPAHRARGGGRGPAHDPAARRRPIGHLDRSGRDRQDAAGDRGRGGDGGGLSGWGRLRRSLAADRSGPRRPDHRHDARRAGGRRSAPPRDTRPGPRRQAAAAAARQLRAGARGRAGDHHAPRRQSGADRARHQPRAAACAGRARVPRAAAAAARDHAAAGARRDRRGFRRSRSSWSGRRPASPTSR